MKKVPHKKGPASYAKVLRALGEYNEDLSKGLGTYEKFVHVVNMHLNLTLPSIKGMHRDHIVPKSFIRKLGLSPLDANHPKNLEYVSPEKNISKFSYIRDREKEHLKVMCNIWNIPYPDHTLIDEHNYTAEIKQTSLNKNKPKIDESK